MYSYDMRVGERHEVGVRLNCDKNGCEPHHADHGYMLRIFDPRSEQDTIDHVLAGGEYRVNNHATDVIQRTVVLPEWEVVS